MTRKICCDMCIFPAEFTATIQDPKDAESTYELYLCGDHSLGTDEYEVVFLETLEAR